MSDRVVHVSGDRAEVLELRLPPQLDFKEFDKLTENVSNVIALRPAARWVIDLAGAEYTGSAMLGLLVNIRQQVKESGGSLVLCNTSERLANVLRACSLDRLFKTVSTRAAAMKAV